MRVSRWGQTGPWKVTQFSEIRTQEETHTGGSGVRVTCGKEKTRGKGRETDESKETELVWVRKTHRKGEKMKFYSQDGVLRISFTNVKLKCWMNVQMYFRANCYKWGKYCVSWKSQLFLGRGKILNVTLISDGHFLPPVGQSLKGMFHGKLLIFSFQWSSVFFFFSTMLLLWPKETLKWQRIQRQIYLHGWAVTRNQSYNNLKPQSLREGGFYEVAKGK